VLFTLYGLDNNVQVQFIEIQENSCFLEPCTGSRLAHVSMWT